MEMLYTLAVSCFAINVIVLVFLGFIVIIFSFSDLHSKLRRQLQGRSMGSDKKYNALLQPSVVLPVMGCAVQFPVLLTAV